MARGFGLLTAAGLVWAGWFFFEFFIPASVIAAGWIFGSLRDAPVGSVVFWEALTIGTLATVQALAPLAVFVWPRVHQAGENRPKEAYRLLGCGSLRSPSSWLS
jgi:hypothetical protein